GPNLGLAVGRRDRTRMRGLGQGLGPVQQGAAPPPGSLAGRGDETVAARLKQIDGRRTGLPSGRRLKPAVYGGNVVDSQDSPCGQQSRAGGWYSRGRRQAGAVNSPSRSIRYCSGKSVDYREQASDGSRRLTGPRPVVSGKIDRLP